MGVGIYSCNAACLLCIAPYHATCAAPQNVGVWFLCTMLNSSSIFFTYHLKVGDYVKSVTCTIALVWSFASQCALRSVVDEKVALQYIQQDDGAALVALLGNNLNVKITECGGTALHVSAQLGKLGVVIMLLRAKASVSEQQDDGKKPIDVARIHGHDCVVALLSKYA